MIRSVPIIALAVFLTACSLASAGELGVDGYRCKVIRVIDGDTLYCGSGWTEYEKVRLIGVFAPELDHYGSQEARRDHLLALSPVGSWVTLKFDVELRDVHKRVLAYVYNEKGVHVNLEIVRSGWAETTNKWPFKQYPEFRQAELEAMADLIGIWKQTVCVTASGKGTKYHPCVCWHLAQSKKVNEMTRAAAKKQGLTPCKTYYPKYYHDSGMNDGK